MKLLTPAMRQHLIYGIAGMTAATEKGLLSRGLIETDPSRPEYWVLSVQGEILRAKIAGRTIVSWKPGVKTDGDEGWVYNGQRFATPAEAALAVDELRSRWFAVKFVHVEPSSDRVNSRWVGGKAEEVA